MSICQLSMYICTRVSWVHFCDACKLWRWQKPHRNATLWLQYISLPPPTFKTNLLASSMCLWSWPRNLKIVTPEMSINIINRFNSGCTLSHLFGHASFSLLCFFSPWGRCTAPRHLESPTHANFEVELENLKWVLNEYISVMTWYMTW